MATYTRDKINKKPVVPQKAATTTQELAKSIAQKEQKPAGIQTQMAQGQPKSPLAGTVSGKELKPIGAAPIPAGTKLDQTGRQSFGGGGQISDQLDMVKTGVTVGNIADKFGDKTISGLESPEAKAEREKREKEAALAAAKAEARRQMEEKAKNNAAELEANADLDGDGKIGSGIESVGGGREMTEEDAINTAIRNLLLEQPDVAEERKAMIDEMKANQARDIQSTRARTGLGGMGLTGAAGALESQVRQETGREQALTTAQFDRAARAEALDRLLKGIGARRGEQVFGAEMEMYESEADIDINGDGFIGGKPVGGEVGDRDPTNNPGVDSSQTGLPQDPEERNDAVSRLETRGRGFAGMPPFHTDDPYVSGPHVIDGLNYYVYKRQNDGGLYRSVTAPQPSERPQEDSGETGGKDAEILQQLLQQYGIG